MLFPRRKSCRLVAVPIDTPTRLSLLNWLKTMPLLTVRHLVKEFPVRGGLLNRIVARVHAVSDISFTVERGEIVGIVGESGCGKSTLGKTIIRLERLTAGEVHYDGERIDHLSRKRLLPVRRKIQMIFQDPNSSLNPRMTIRSILREPALFHRVVPASQIEGYIDDLMAKVGTHASAKDKYPHEFSGGQKQRIGIARALAVQPEFIIADEPVSALDVSIQAQILNLLSDLKRDFDLTMIFISHDLKVVDHFCDRMLVMYLGKVVEEMPCQDIATDARHPYTQALVASNPVSDPDERRELTVLDGDVPSPFSPPPGCPFVSRCPVKQPRCEAEMPPLVNVDDDHRVACWEVPVEKGADPIASNE